MKIYITEEQNKKLFEARMDGFRLDIFVSVKSFAERVRYCEQMLGSPIGNGSSRIVFQLDDYSVLKLAKNQKGVAQNLEEIKLGTEPYLSSFPKILNGSDENNGLWIISEAVLPAKANDFRKVLGMPFKDIQEFIWGVVVGNSRGYNKYADKKVHELYAKYEENDDVMELFNDLYELYCGFDNDIGDLKRICNWGMCNRDGVTRIVILDVGFSGEIRDKYYRHG